MASESKRRSVPDHSSLPIEINPQQDNHLKEKTSSLYLM